MRRIHTNPALGSAVIALLVGGGLGIGIRRRRVAPSSLGAMRRAMKEQGESDDGGNTFAQVNGQAAYGSLSVSPAQPQVLYGKTGTTVYRSRDGGHTWNPLPHISGNLAVLAADPNNALQVYLSLSYPTAMYRFDLKSSSWQSITPPVQ